MAGLADAVAALEKRLAETRARLDELDADVDRQRREKKEPDIQIAIRKGVIELLRKEPGADPEDNARLLAQIRLWVPIPDSICKRNACVRAGCLRL